MYSKMSSLIPTLKARLQSYRAIDDELQELNKKIYTLRSTRKEIESEMATILQHPELKEIEALNLVEDGSVVKIQRPGWNKAWGLSKKELKVMLDSYFDSTNVYDSTDCYDFIVNAMKPKLVSTEFSFTRVKND